MFIEYFHLALRFSLRRFSQNAAAIPHSPRCISTTAHASRLQESSTALRSTLCSWNGGGDERVSRIGTGGKVGGPPPWRGEEQAGSPVVGGPRGDVEEGVQRTRGGEDGAGDVPLRPPHCLPGRQLLARWRVFRAAAKNPRTQAIPNPNCFSNQARAVVLCSR